MENIDDCYEFIKLIANKNQQGFLSPGQFNRAWNSAEMQLFAERDAAYAKTRKVADDLDRFVTRVEFRPTRRLPFWTRPANMVRLTASLAEYEGSLVDAEEITHAELGGRLRSSIVEPTLEYPVIVFGATQMEVYPPVVPRLVLTYLRYPVPGQWAGDVVNKRLIYNATTSKQPEWPRDTWNELCVRALSFLGMNLKAVDLVQYAAVKKQEVI